jgi:hypothetical protein
MVGPFALYFGIRPWELRDPEKLTHHEFLGLERLALDLMSKREAGRGGG